MQRHRVPLQVSGFQFDSLRWGFCLRGRQRINRIERIEKIGAVGSYCYFCPGTQGNGAERFRKGSLVQMNRDRMKNRPSGVSSMAVKSDQ
jgi:hypothetical protein